MSRQRTALINSLKKYGNVTPRDDDGFAVRVNDDITVIITRTGEIQWADGTDAGQIIALLGSMVTGVKTHNALNRFFYGAVDYGPGDEKDKNDAD